MDYEPDGICRFTDLMRVNEPDDDLESVSMSHTANSTVPKRLMIKLPVQRSNTTASTFSIIESPDGLWAEVESKAIEGSLSPSFLSTVEPNNVAITIGELKSALIKDKSTTNQLAQAKRSSSMLPLNQTHEYANLLSSEPSNNMANGSAEEKSKRRSFRPRKQPILFDPCEASAESLQTKSSKAIEDKDPSSELQSSASDSSKAIPRALPICSPDSKQAKVFPSSHGADLANSSKRIHAVVNGSSEKAAPFEDTIEVLLASAQVNTKKKKPSIPPQPKKFKLQISDSSENTNKKKPRISTEDWDGSLELHHEDLRNDLDQINRESSHDDFSIPKKPKSEDHHSSTKMQASLDFIATGSEKGFKPPESPEIINNDYCDACGEHGHFICCDKCPRSFHFTCITPPIDPEDVPEDSWFCVACRKSTTADTNYLSGAGINLKPFERMKRVLQSKNESTFGLPKKMRNRYSNHNDSSSKMPFSRSGISQKAHFHTRTSNALIRDTKDRSKRFCHQCRRDEGPILQVAICSFCDLAWHLDCLDPPLTAIPPDGSDWRCPAHIEEMTNGRLKKHILNKKRLRQEHCQVIKVEESKQLPPDAEYEIELDQAGETDEIKKPVIYRLPERSIRLEFSKAAATASPMTMFNGSNKAPKSTVIRIPEDVLAEYENARTRLEEREKRLERTMYSQFSNTAVETD